MLFGFDYFFILPEIYFSFAIIIFLLFSVELLNHLKINALSVFNYFFQYLSIIFFFLFTQVPSFSCSLFNFSYVLDLFSVGFRVVIFIFFLLIIFFSFNYFFNERVYFVEYFFLVGFFLISAILLVSSNDFILFYFSIELQALILYTLASLKRYTIFSTESGLKYFVLGALSSGLLLYGISLFYGFSGVLNFFEYQFLFDSFSGGYYVYGFVIAAAFILSGLLFKLAAAPFHIWAPDVYDGAPTLVVLFFAILPKFAVFIFITKFYFLVMQYFSLTWYFIFMFSGFFSVIIGTFTAFNQFTIKRLYIYSAIVNVGYVLIALTVGLYANVVAVFNYLPVYFFSTFLLFTFILLFRRSDSHCKIKFLVDYRLFLTYNFFVAFGFAVLFFSLAGIPPLAGFFVKFFLFKAIFVTDFLRNSLFFVTLLFSVVAAFYYIRVVRFVFFDTTRRPVLFVPLQFSMCFITINIIFVLSFFLFLQPTLYLLAGYFVSAFYI